MRETMDSALMPGSKTPKPPEVQIHFWPGCQRRTSSFQFTAMRLITVLPASAFFVAATAALYCECQVVKSTLPFSPANTTRSCSSLSVAAGGFSSMTCLPAASASWAVAWRTCGGVQTATASMSGTAAIHFRRRLEGRNARHRQAALAGDGGELEGLVSGDHRHMLIVGDLAETDDPNVPDTHCQAVPRIFPARAGRILHGKFPVSRGPAACAGEALRQDRA